MWFIWICRNIVNILTLECIPYTRACFIKTTWWKLTQMSFVISLSWKHAKQSNSNRKSTMEMLCERKAGEKKEESGRGLITKRKRWKRLEILLEMHQITSDLIKDCDFMVLWHNKTHTHTSKMSFYQPQLSSPTRFFGFLFKFLMCLFPPTIIITTRSPDNLIWLDGLYRR